MNVNNRPYLAAYMSVDSDPGANYGKITVLRLPAGSVVNGPEQVHANFNAETTISKDVNLLGSGGSSVVWGNLLTMPVGSSFLYVQPLYVQAQQNGFPILQRVAVYYGDKIGYGENLANALSDLSTGNVGSTIGQASNSPSPAPSSTPTTSSPSKSPTPPSSSGSSSPSKSPTSTPSSSLNAQINSAYNDLQNATKTGDFAKIGAAQQKLNDLIAQYLATVK